MFNFDFTPLYRSSIGFDHLASLLDSANQLNQSQNGYPPYNIEVTGEDKYRISMAVAGFEESELSIEIKENKLTVSGKKSSDDVERKYLHQGIAARNFERHFQLTDHVKVASATMKNGLLHIDLYREIPEAMKPRTIEIKTDQKLLSH